MHPVLFTLGPVTIYTYGFCIAIGALLGFLYMNRLGSKFYGLTFDQSNTLFILLVLAGFVGGKFFMLFESPSYYFQHPGHLFSGSGFVFYGSFLFAIPCMLWYFRKNKIPTLGMLDIMAPVTCIVHGFGRIGCFMAGCCYGKPTLSSFGVIFTDAKCQAEPLNTRLYPTQLMEAGLIFIILGALLLLRHRKKFDGQLFLIYLMSYATGRGILEIFRGDLDRGFLIKDVLSNSQLISLLIIALAAFFYVKWNKKGNLTDVKIPPHGK
jgi:phosphatidylglycerol---prolipoprotein diacylglyceryl transferase